MPEIVPPAATVIVFTALQPPLLYVITTVPAEMPVTMPEELTCAFDVSLLLHVPPPTVDVSVIVDPTHTELLPEMAALALTVTDLYV